MESIPDDWKSFCPRNSLYMRSRRNRWTTRCTDSFEVSPRPLLILQLELSIYRYLHPPRSYLEALRARLISAEQYSVSGIFVPSYRKNQRARNVAPMCLFSIPSFSRPAIKSCCWKYYLGESPHPRYTGSLQSVGRDSPSFSDSHWWISIIWQTSFETSSAVCWPTCGGTGRSSFPPREYQKRTRVSSAAIAYYCFINEFLLLFAFVADIYSHGAATI